MNHLQKLFARTMQIVFTALLLLEIPLIVCADEIHENRIEPYQLGVFPFLPPRELEDIFAPFAASIGEALGKEVQFHSAISYQNFMERADANQYDIAFVQPFDYVRLADQQHYVPLATVSEKLFAIFVVKEGSPITKLEDLKGKVIAMPPAVAAVSRLSLIYLHDHGIEPGAMVTVTHHRSHSSCLQQVLIGAADACATALPPIRFIQQRMKVKFTQIARTMEIPHTLFVANPTIPESERRVILDTILSWSNSESGKQMLERARMKSFVVVHDKQYDIIRRMLKAESDEKTKK